MCDTEPCKGVWVCGVSNCKDAQHNLNQQQQQEGYTQFSEERVGLNALCYDKESNYNECKQVGHISVHHVNHQVVVKKVGKWGLLFPQTRGEEMSVDGWPCGCRLGGF